jgi:hypothetical protein
MSTDPLTLLREADPARYEQPDRLDAEALLSRVLADRPPPGARHRIRWALVPAGAAVLLVAALVAFPRPGAAERAYAAVTPVDQILHVDSTLLVSVREGDRLIAANRRQTWEATNPSRQRIVVTALRPGGVELTMFETASSPRGTRGWTPSSNEIRVAARPIDPIGETTAVEVFRRLYREGAVAQRGRVTVYGRDLVRLSTTGGRRTEFLVDPESFEPVLVRRYDGERITQEERLTIERLPFDADTERLLELSPHPGAEIVGWDG